MTFEQERKRRLAEELTFSGDNNFDEATDH
jgi:hypothetical protein